MACREFREPAVILSQLVDCEDAESAAVGQNREPVALGARSRRERPYGVKQLVEALDTQHSGAAERCVVDGIRAGERPGMRKGSPGAGVASAGLDDHDGLGA